MEESAYPHLSKPSLSFEEEQELRRKLRERLMVIYQDAAITELQDSDVLEEHTRALYDMIINHLQKTGQTLDHRTIARSTWKRNMLSLIRLEDSSPPAKVLALAKCMPYTPLAELDQEATAYHTSEEIRTDYRMTPRQAQPFLTKSSYEEQMAQLNSVVSEIQWMRENVYTRDDAQLYLNEAVKAVDERVEEAGLHSRSSLRKSVALFSVLLLVLSLGGYLLFRAYLGRVHQEVRGLGGGVTELGEKVRGLDQSLTGLNPADIKTILEKLDEINLQDDSEEKKREMAAILREMKTTERANRKFLKKVEYRETKRSLREAAEAP